MVQIRFASFLVGLGLALAVSACASAPMYAGKEIRGKIIDADTKQPIEGTIIVAQWILFHIQPGHGGHKSRIHIDEAVADKDGNYVIPAWGPKPHLPFTELQERDPELLIFKSGYLPKGVTNRFIGEDKLNRGVLRISDWDGKSIDLKKTEANIQYIRSLGILSTGLNSEDWRNFPRMVVALDGEAVKLDELLKQHPGRDFRVFNIDRASDSDKAHIRRYMK